MSLVFYDTETTGVETSFDQILQFAGVLTDPELNVLDRFQIRSRLRPDVVPSPGAMQVNGTTVARLTDRTLPSHYEMVRQIRDKLVSWSPAIFVGYNSRDFDEHLLRQAFYQTLYPPYLTNTDGNARTDALRMVQATSLFVPGALDIPRGADGKAVFKLDRVAPANGFIDHHAHDAMGDVDATIHICRRIIANAPHIWSAFMRFSKKATVDDYLLNERVVSLSDFYYGRPSSWLVTVIGTNPNNRSEHYAFDLATDPSRLVTSTDKQLRARLEGKPRLVLRIKSNGAPILMPAEDAPEIAASKQFSIQELERRAEVLHATSGLRERILSVHAKLQVEKPLSPHVEEQIYNGFPSEADQNLMDAFHELSWKDRLSVLDDFADKRLQLLARRLMHTERPDLLKKTERAKCDQAVAKRLLQSGDGVPWTTLPRAIREADKLLVLTSEGPQTELLREHHRFLTSLREAAELALRS